MSRPGGPALNGPALPVGGTDAVTDGSHRFRSMTSPTP